MEVTQTTKDSMVRSVGRRKKASARVRISKGKGDITINGKDFKIYFPVKLYQDDIIAPLKVTGRLGSIDVSAKIAGGGLRGQSGAVRHGIARALILWDETLRPVLKAEGYLTRDPRAKERKKPGLYKARRAHQWRKR